MSFEEFLKKCNLSVKDYEDLYRKIVYMSFNCDGVGLYGQFDLEDVQKCLWIYKILDVMNDVPKAKLRSFINRYEEAEMLIAEMEEAEDDYWISKHFASSGN